MLEKANLEKPKDNVFINAEEEILKHWKQHKIQEKAKKRLEGKKRFYFLDGPPYTSGRVHLGTAWNKSLKDMVLRYKRMNGLNVWDKAGYDMHGLPTEHATEKKLGLNGKDDILKIGVEKFVTECKKLCLDNMKLMSEDFKRLGVWMDFENAYYTIDPKYIESCWWLIKKADENKRLYLGEKTMHWCADCGSALAKHELEYKNVNDQSVFLKFKVLGSVNEYLIIWTTTPWTIPFNLGVMVNPDLEYVKIKVYIEDKEKDGKEKIEQWIVSKGLVGVFMGSVVGKKYDLIEEFMGEKLKGIKYIHPFHDVAPKIYDEIEKNHPNTFSIVLSEEYVDLSAGTGLVHMAPGCGPEDYEIGHRNGIPPFNNLNEQGVFPKTMGRFSGWTAKKDDAKFIDEFRNLGILIETTEVEHEYAHCWRCKSPVIFRTTKQWFFKVEDLKDTMRELNKNIYWIPGFAGQRNFDSWLSNLRDNGITRQRFWGTPLPIWKCTSKECEHYLVIGSIKDLEKKVGKKGMPKDLHKPWIDETRFKCDKCGGEMRRESDILDVWIDAGVGSWACLDYPHREDHFKEMYPAEFILEGIDQIRGWFNMLFVASMVSMGRPSYKSVYMHGFINDSLGRKMSKSLGNYILPAEVIESYGSETLRYYMIGGTQPGMDLNYNFEDMKAKFRNLGVLWNVHKFMIDLKKTTSLELKAFDDIDKKDCSIAELYILSKLNSKLGKVRAHFEAYNLTEIPNEIEELFLELSRTYIQLVREKAGSGDKEEKELVLGVVFKVFMDTLKMFAPICPMLTEKMFLDIKEEFNLEEESIHFYPWPQADESWINEELEKSFDAAKDVIQAVLGAREKAKLGVRWPLKEAIVVSADKSIRKSVKDMEEVIKVHTNTKSLSVHHELKGLKINIRPNYKTLGMKYAQDVPIIVSHFVTCNENSVVTKLNETGSYEFSEGKKTFKLIAEDLKIDKEAPKHLLKAESKKGEVYIDVTRTPELDAEGYAREITRRVQSLRKDSGLQKNDEINLCIMISTELLEAIEPFIHDLRQKCGVKELHAGEEKKEFKNTDQFNIKGKDVWISLEKV